MNEKLRTWWLLDTSEKVYCRYEEENSQRHLEEPRLNQIVGWENEGK